MFRKGSLVFLGVVLFVLVGFSALEGQQSYLYFTEIYARSIIGWTDFNKNVSPQTIPGTGPCGIAVNDKYIYWTNFFGGSIGRVGLDGTDYNNSFITGCENPWGLAINDKYIYWTNIDTLNAIGRARLDGAPETINQSFIPLPGRNPRGMVATKDYIYWTNSSTRSIGRATVEGQNINMDWIPNCGESPHNVTVTDTQIYWVNHVDCNICRANIEDGLGVEIVLGGLAGPTGIVVKGEDIYYVNHWSGWIGWSNLSGTSYTLNWLEDPGIICIATTPDVINVAIDIKPGSYPNTINLGSNGVVPVAIISSETFDATTVDPMTVKLAGAGVQVKGNGTPLMYLQDVDKDGRLDIVVHVTTSAFTLSSTDTYATLTGNTTSGRKFRGQDTIRVVK
jgi:virginiamycin B lyase